MNFDGDIFLYVIYGNQSNYITVSFKSHVDYHLNLVKQAVSAAFEAFNVDDFDFYWDQVRIPEKDLVRLIKAKQFCGNFRITMKEKIIPIRDETVIQNEIPVLRTIKVEEGLEEHKPIKRRDSLDSIVDEIHQFLDEEDGDGNHNITSEENQQVNHVEEEINSEIENTNQSTQENDHHENRMEVEETSDQVSNKDKEDNDSSFSQSNSSSEEESETKNDEESKHSKYKFKAPPKGELAAFKEHLKSTLGSAILSLCEADTMPVLDRKNIIKHSVKYLLAKYGVYPSIGQKADLVSMLAEIFKPFRSDKKQVLDWLLYSIFYYRNKDKEEKKSNESENSDTKITKEEISKFKEFCKAKIGSKVFLMDCEITMVNRRIIITCAVKYLFEKCGIHPNTSQKSHLCRLLVEVFKPFKKVEEKTILNWISDQACYKRSKILEIEKQGQKKTTKKRKREDSDNENVQPAKKVNATDNSLSAKNNESNEKSFLNSPFDVQVTIFKEYFNSNAETKMHLLGDPLKTESRRTIMDCAVKFLISECGVLANASQRNILLRILLEVFIPFRQNQSKVLQWITDKVRYHRLNALDKEEGVAKLLEKAKKRKQILTGQNDINNSNEPRNMFSRDTDKSDNLLSQPFEVEVSKFKDFFNDNAKIQIHLIDDPLKSQNRFDIMKLAGQYILDQCGMYPSAAQRSRLIIMLMEVFEPFKSVEKKTLSKWVNEKIQNMRRQTKDKEEKQKEEELRKSRKSGEMLVSKLKEHLDKNPELKLYLKDPLDVDNRHCIIKCAVQYLLDECGNDPTVDQKAHLISMLVEVVEKYKSVEEETLTKWVNVKVAVMRNKVINKEEMGKPTETQITKFKDYFNSNAETKLDKIDDPMSQSNRYNIIKCAAKYLIDECGMFPNTADKFIMTKILGEVFEPFKEDEKLVYKWVADKVKNSRFYGMDNKQKSKTSTKFIKNKEDDSEDSESESEDDSVEEDGSEKSSKNTKNISKNTFDKKTSSDKSKQITKIKDYFKKSSDKSN
ncbi:hypothetical protein ACFFRR_002940 [Megaselia abdita]